MKGEGYVFLGPPGVGKGTQAKLFAQRHKVCHLSTGDALRNAVRRKTQIGLEAQAIMEKGALVSDSVVAGIVRERLQDEDCLQGFLLDGFPRTMAQAELLDEILSDLKISLKSVLNFTATDEILIKRLSGRRTCPGCDTNYHVEFHPPKNEGLCDACGGVLKIRNDDQPQVIQDRLSVYKKETLPLEKRYRESGLLSEVNGTGQPEEIASRVDALVL